MNTIQQNIGDYNTWLSHKQSRITQVRIEIAQETAKDTIDPNALGVRTQRSKASVGRCGIRATELKNTNIERVDRRTEDGAESPRGCNEALPR